MGYENPFAPSFSRPPATVREPVRRRTGQNLYAQSPARRLPHAHLRENEWSGLVLYEFCSPEEYTSLRTSNDHYFLNLAHDEGIAFLILSKGGKDDEKESLKKPFEVVRVPIANYEDPSGRELVLMGAFLDIIQAFVEEAMVSDRTAYSGLSAANGSQLRGKVLYLDPDRADEACLQQEPDALVGITIAPTQISFNTVCYKMLIAADTHELSYYDKARYKGPLDGRFTDAEIKRFERRGAEIRQ